MIVIFRRQGGKVLRVAGFGKEDCGMTESQIKKLAVGGMLVAFSVALSGFSIPIGASRCFPIQHMSNIVAGIFLGPWHGVAMAFCTSLIRNLMGTGSLLAFPGSMVGALICGCLYRHTGRRFLAYAGEVFGTGILGGMMCYPIALLLMHNQQAALFTYVVPFLMSTACGTVIAAALIEAMDRSGVLSYLKRGL